MAQVNGTNSPETLDSEDGVTNQADSVFGLDGNDTIFGLGGNDILTGGIGGDVLNGGAGIDTAAYTDSAGGVTVSLLSSSGSHGDAEGDELNGIENLTGSTGGDTLWGNDGVNVLKGLGNMDKLKGFGGADVLWGGEHDDRLDGGTGNDTLRGEGWADDLNGGPQRDVLIGGESDDNLNGGAGADRLLGGPGDDDYIVDSARDTIVETAISESNDRVEARVSYRLSNAARIETFTTNDIAGTSPINLTGNAFRQEMQGTAGANTLSGLGGNDDLHGDSGKNTLNGGGDADVLTGGDGRDRLSGNAGRDTFYYTSIVESEDGAATRDTIVDLASGDRIDVHEIDAKTGLADDQSFVLVVGGRHHRLVQYDRRGWGGYADRT